MLAFTNHRGDHWTYNLSKKFGGQCWIELWLERQGQNFRWTKIMQLLAKGEARSNKCKLTVYLTTPCLLPNSLLGQNNTPWLFRTLWSHISRMSSTLHTHSMGGRSDASHAKDRWNGLDKNAATVMAVNKVLKCLPPSSRSSTVWQSESPVTMYCTAAFSSSSFSFWSSPPDLAFIIICLTARPAPEKSNFQLMVAREDGSAALSDENTVFSFEVFPSTQLMNAWGN